MNPLTREAILSVSDLVTEVVPVPEWGGSVIVTTMTGAMRDAWERTIITPEGKPAIENVRAKLVVSAVIGEDGKPLFTVADVEALGAKSAAALDRVARVAQRLNRLTEAELEATLGN